MLCVYIVNCIAAWTVRDSVALACCTEVAGERMPGERCRPHSPLQESAEKQRARRLSRLEFSRVERQR